MAMLQHYYTSCVHGTSGGAGFQVKALSPGISEEEQKAINSLISYRIPPTMPLEDIRRHPIALRYEYLSSSRCILSCSQSNGSDESGRPGNFFAHSVITSPQAFDILPPIMFWRHPFWRTSDPSTRLEIPPESEFDLEPSLEFERIWPFLNQGKRRDWFRRLLAAVVNYDQRPRPIIILDETDNVALWIAALTFALPAVLRPVLTFATYHHDPYQIPFRIIGTTKDGRFRFSADEYISFFVCNVEADRISETATSVYADYVADQFQPDLYEEKLLAFFDMCNIRLARTRQGAGIYLDELTNRYLTMREKRLSLADSTAQRSLNLFLDEAERQGSLLPEDLADLQAITDQMAREVAATSNSPLALHYGRAMRVLKRVDPNFVRRWRTDIDLLIKTLARGDEALAGRLTPLYKELYGEQFSLMVSRPESMDDLSRALDGGRRESAYILLWRHLGPLFRYDAGNSTGMSSLIKKTLSLVELSAAEESDKLVAELVNANRGDKQTILMDSIANWRQQGRAGRVFGRLYAALVSSSALEERDPYRRHFTGRGNGAITLEELIGYEVEHEAKGVTVEGTQRLLERWLNHLERHPGLRPAVTRQSLELLWAAVSPARKSWLAEQLLASPLISANLDGRWTEQLMSTYLQGLSLKSADPQTVKLYEKYLERDSLRPDQRGMIAGVLALSTGRFFERSMPLVRRWLGTVDEATYQDAAEKLIGRFFEGDFLIESHLEMIQALFVQRYEGLFWEQYWQQFRQMLAASERVKKCVELLTFWFDESPSVLQELPYIVPTFFVQLPAVVESLREEKAMRQGVNQLKYLAAREKWYSVIHPYLEEDDKKGGLFGRWRR